jgi:hypothetical protein
MAQVTPNMQLVVWNNPTDLYDSSQLAKNFIAIDEHDHSGNGKGKAIDGTNIKVGTISSTQIANNTITAGNIAPSAVDTGELVDSSVTTAKIANTAVTTGKIANTAVTTDKFATSVQEQMGFDTSTVKRKRYKYIAAQETITSTDPAYATTADSISNLVVADPTNSGFGIINFAYLAQWRTSSSTSSSAAARLYITNDSGVSVVATCLDPNGGSAYTAYVRTALTTGTLGGESYWRPIHTVNGGWVPGTNDNTNANSGGTIPTGLLGKTDQQGVGLYGLWGNGTFNYTVGTTWLNTPSTGFNNNGIPFVMPPKISILVPSGTYTVGIKYNQGASGGGVVVKQRHMWAWTESFVKE